MRAENKDDYTPIPDINGFLSFMEKNRLFYVDEVRKWVNDYFNEKISLSKLTELLNEKFFNWHQLQSAPLPVTGESEAIGERKFTLDEILLYGARCAVNGRKMNPVAYFKEHFNVDITIGDNL